MSDIVVSLPVFQLAKFGLAPRRRIILKLLVILGFILTSVIATMVYAKENKIEESLDQLRERFQITPTADGWHLKPLEDLGKFESIDVSSALVSVDGERVTESGLWRFVSMDDAELLFLIASGGHRYVDTVPWPTTTGGSRPPGGPSDDSESAVRRRVRLRIDQCLELLLPGEANHAARERLRELGSVESLRRKIKTETCQVRSDLTVTAAESAAVRGLDVVESALCSELSVGSGERSGDAVAIGGNLLVAGFVEGHATAIVGDAVVEGKIEGDLIVVGGSIELRSVAVVSGDVIILGGIVDIEPGAIVQGEVLRLDYGKVMEAEVP